VTCGSNKSDRTRVRLSDVADVSVRATPTVIRHERIAPYVDVVANVAGRDPGAVAGELEERLRKMSFPLEHRAELLGEFVERAQAKQRAVGIVAAALIGIFLLLQACFRSWGLAVAGFLSLVASIAGGVLAASLAGVESSLGSMVGLLAVLGIARAPRHLAHRPLPMARGAGRHGRRRRARRPRNGSTDDRDSREFRRDRCRTAAHRVLGTIPVSRSRIPSPWSLPAAWSRRH